MIGLAMGSPWRRREVLAASLATAATLLTAPGANLRAQPARVRHEVHDPAAAPMLELYKRAIREMKRRPAWDPTSWWFQDQIVQEGIGRFAVRLQGRGAGNPATATAVRAAIQAEVGTDSRIDLRWEADLEPPAGHKFRVVECRIGNTGT